MELVSSGEEVLPERLKKESLFFRESQEEGVILFSLCGVTQRLPDVQHNEKNFMEKQC